MPLIVDCYNLLHQPMPPSLAGLDEQRLCRAIRGSVWGAEGAAVVCDGVPKPGVAAGTCAPGVKLIYSGPRRTADDVIRALVKKSSAPRRLTVVSDDREVQLAVRRRRARVLSCQAFIHSLVAPAGGHEAGSAAKPAVHPAELLNAEQWAAEFGVDLEQSLEELDR